jgi:hypothetical protein
LVFRRRRIKPGVTLQQARAEMGTIAARIAGEYPESNKGWGAAHARIELRSNEK